MQNPSYPSRLALTYRAFYCKAQTAKQIEPIIQTDIPPTQLGHRWIFESPHTQHINTLQAG